MIKIFVKKKVQDDKEDLDTSLPRFPTLEALKAKFNPNAIDENNSDDEYENGYKILKSRLLVAPKVTDETEEGKEIKENDDDDDELYGDFEDLEATENQDQEEEQNKSTKQQKMRTILLILMLKKKRKKKKTMIT